MPDNLITVKLKAPHTHEGKPQKTGDILVINQALADWLIVRGIAEIIIIEQDH
jgi:hypothetical protein